MSDEAGGGKGFLDRVERVYGSKSLDELRESYAEWAAQYDRDVMSVGYQIPAMVAAMTARYISPKAGAILDCGAGTGMIGMLLKALGYEGLAALDLSQDMLDVARARNIYDSLHQAVLGEPLDFPDQRFAAVVAGGVFTAGHAPPESFDEICRITRPEGLFIFAARADGDHAARYLEKARHMESEKRWQLRARSEPYQTFPLSAEEEHVLNQIHVYRVAG